MHAKTCLSQSTVQNILQFKFYYYYFVISESRGRKLLLCGASFTNTSSHPSASMVSVKYNTLLMCQCNCEW